MADEPVKSPEEIKTAEEAAAKAKTDADKKAEDDAKKTVPHQAFHEEREKRKEAEAKLKKFHDEEAERNRKAEEEKGNFKKLYEDEVAKGKTLSEQLTGVATRLSQFEEAAQGNINTSIESVKSDEDKAMIKKLLEGKSLAEQQAVLPKLLEKFGAPSDINPSGKGGGKGATSDDKEVARQAAKEKGNVLSMIANAPARVKS